MRIIVNITEHGVFVKAPCGIEGLVNKSNLSENRDEPYEEAVKKYNVGDKINVYVVDVNPDRQKAAFSVKDKLDETENERFELAR